MNPIAIWFHARAPSRFLQPTALCSAALALLAGGCLDADIDDIEMSSTATEAQELSSGPEREPAALLPEKRYVMNDKSNLCAGIDRGSTTTARAIQWHCDRALDKVWTFHSHSNGELEIVNANSAYCLAVGEAKLNAGAAVIQFPCNDRREQRWRRVRADHLFVYQNVNSGHCLSVDRGRTTAGAGLIQWHCRDFRQAEQKWLETAPP